MRRKEEKNLALTETRTPIPPPSSTFTVEIKIRSMTHDPHLVSYAVKYVLSRWIHNETEKFRFSQK
jgi:hypothetical protein